MVSKNDVPTLKKYFHKLSGNHETVNYIGKHITLVANLKKQRI